MDKYEFKIKADQITKLVERKDYKTAAKIADGIDWRRVRNVELLLKVSEIYERLDRLEDCYEILNMAYDRAPIGRTIVYRMAEMATRMGDFDEAVELYKEFVKIAPHDLSRYVLKYKIYQAKGAALTDQIAILEEFKSREYHEKWAYELAVLYYQEGMNAKCVEECDDLVLWFSEGEYVRRALELKMRIQSLTASQEEKYRELIHGSEEAGQEPIPEAYTEEPEEEAAGEVSEDSREAGEIVDPAAPVSRDTGNIREAWMVTEEQDKRRLVQAEDIKVRTLDPQERYNTMNLQAELAAGLKDLFDEPKNSAVETEVTEKPVEVKLPTTTMPMRTVEPVKAATTFQEVNSLRLGQREDGQLTFDETENVIERQITGQMTIDEILAEWEVKKKQMEARIAQAAEEDRQRKAEECKRAEAERAAAEAERQRIEAERAAAEAERQRMKAERAAAEAERQRIEAERASIPDIIDILLEPEAIEEAPVEAVLEPGEEEPEDIMSLLEAAPEELPDIEEEVEDDLPQEVDEIEAMLMAALEEDEAEKNRKEEEAAEKKAEAFDTAVEPEPVEVEPVEAEAPKKKPTPKKEEPASNMIEDLERLLEQELKHVTGQHLTAEQEKLFAYFTAVHGMNQQLSQFLEEEGLRQKDGTSTAGNLVVTGERGTGKSTLAVDLVKAVQKQRRVKGIKMAKVSGEDLSQKDVAEVVRKLSGGALVVEHAGGLTTEAASRLSGAMLGQTGDLFVVLEDEPAEIKRLFVRCESLAAKFTKTIEIPVFTNNELVAFGKSYAGEQGYVLDEMAVLALYNRIGNNQTSDHMVNVAEVKEIIDEAIAKANKKGLARLFSKRRQDEFGNYILLEKHFEE